MFSSNTPSEEKELGTYNSQHWSEKFTGTLKFEDWNSAMKFMRSVHVKKKKESNYSVQYNFQNDGLSANCRSELSQMETAETMESLIFRRIVRGFRRFIIHARYARCY